MQNKCNAARSLFLKNAQISVSKILTILLLILLYFPCLGGNLNDLITLPTNKIDTEIINQFIRNNSFK